MVIATKIKPGENVTDEIFCRQKNSRFTVVDTEVYKVAESVGTCTCNAYRADPGKCNGGAIFIN